MRTWRIDHTSIIAVINGTPWSTCLQACDRSPLTQHTDGQQRQRGGKRNPLRNQCCCPDVASIWSLKTSLWEGGVCVYVCVRVCAETTQRAGVSTWNKAGRFLSLSVSCVSAAAAAGVRCRPLHAACCSCMAFNADYCEMTTFVQRLVHWSQITDVAPADDEGHEGAAGVGEQIVVVEEGRSDVNCLLADWMFLSSGRVPVFSWAVSLILTAFAYQICRLRLVIGGGGEKEDRILSSSWTACFHWCCSAWSPDKMGSHLPHT